MSVVARKQTENYMSKNHIYYRIVGHMIMLFILVRSSFYVQLALTEKIKTYPELQVFQDLGPRYATVWNLFIQFTYASIALTCDLSELLGKDHLVPNDMRKFRYSLFSGLFYPMAMTLPIIFWPIYIYDRELVFPRKVDVFMSFLDNFICHGLVTIYAFYELVFIPRDSLKDAKTYRYVVWFTITFVFVFYFTRYVDLGIWMYDVYYALEGTIAFHLLLASPFICSTFFYHTQRWTQEAVWKYRERLEKDDKLVQ